MKISLFSLRPFFLIFSLLFLSSKFQLQNACPFQVRAFCACVDHVDGVQLNCTVPAEGAANESGQIGKMKSGKQQQNENGATQMMELLRSSQAHLGLLKVLTIHSSSIKTLSNNFFAGLYIRRLELINCEIELLEKGAFGGLENVLQELAINGNRIKEMIPETIAGFHSLVRLDLSNNSIEELKVEHSLPRLPKLTDIDLSHNRISAVHKTFFDGVKGTVQTINLGHNVIEEVPASAIRGFRMLMALHLHNNLLNGILPALSFMNLPVLSLLNLAGNQLSAMHRQAFLNAPMLRYLYLSANRLTQILPFQLSSFERLEMLDLSNNWVEVLGNDSFAGLPSLRQLYLGENHIRSIEPFAFSQNSSIAVLILEQNWMTEVTKDNFRPLKQLQQLSLKNNKLRSVDVAAFQANPSLVMLDLSRNELIDLSPGTFLSQLNLLLVDLSFNKIVRTPFGAFGRRIATVLLQENPLVCVEQIHMLQQGNGVFIPNSEDKICGKDSTTKSTTLSEIESLSADQIEDNASEETEAAEESAFVQQQSTTPPKGTTDQFAETIETTNNGHKMGKMPNIRPIQIGHKQRQKAAIAQVPSADGFVAESSPSAELTEQNAKLMQQNQKNNGAELDQFSLEGNEIRHQQRKDSKELNSGPIPLNEKIENGEGISKERDRTAETESLTATDTVVAETTDAPSSTTVDPRNDPAVIYPHPVPFLATGPKLHTAHSINTEENGSNSMLTLPPNIVMAGGGEEEQSLSRPTEDENEVAKKGEKENGQNFANISQLTKENGEDGQKWEEFELRTKNGNNEMERNSAEIKGEEDKFSEGKAEEESTMNMGNSRQKSMGKPLPTAVIAICLGTVGVVMFAVFVGMCVAKKRQIRSFSAGRASDIHSLQHSPNSNAYMSAAVAARAAQLNGMIYSATPLGDSGGTMPRGGAVPRSRSNSANGAALPMSRITPSQEDIYGWIYSQHAYNAYAK
ncbi:hypothetical protein niasHT_024343 [Heterodera trifolii]|uniref:Uncharacterized protein n=1 Tax=Heterodera trifolii TaxID=157864 RepID=A0ABD2JMC0_9BILA